MAEGDITPAEAMGLALIVDDPNALRVAAAYYSLPKRKRDDVDMISEVSGVSQNVNAVLTRLRAAGMLQDEPPRTLMRLVATWVARKMK